MITYMQFIDNDTEFCISELDEKDKVCIIMGEVGDEFRHSIISLGETEIRRLYVWLKEAVDMLEDSQQKSP